MTFRVITGSGHCGTMWLARILDELPGQHWTHELRTTITGWPWQMADALPPNSTRFDKYWHRIYALANRYAVVGDSNSWPPEALPAVNRIMPIDRVIYLTRDKERQLYSILNTSPVWSHESRPTAARARLDLYSRISGQPVSDRLLVEANDFMPDWLRGQGLAVDAYSLEELTTNIQRLRRVAPLDDDTLRHWQSTKVNQKVFDYANA